MSRTYRPRPLKSARTPGRRRFTRIAGTVVLASAGSIAFAGSSVAAGNGPVPFVDCVTHDSVTHTDTAYFGYSNTGSPVTIPIGDNNQDFPTSPNGGQPASFGHGSFPRTHAVRFDPSIFPAIAWILNGLEADATDGSPACVSGVTGPASAVSTTSATLNGTVVPDDAHASYSFEYGTSPSYGQTTPAQDADGTQPSGVQATLNGLSPATTYYYRLDSTTSIGTTYGAQQTFTTPAANSGGSGGSGGSTLRITTTTLPTGHLRHRYYARVQATYGRTPFTWTIVRGGLPRGLRLNGRTGEISGLPLRTGGSHFLLTLVDSSKSEKVAIRELSINIKR